MSALELIKETCVNSTASRVAGYDFLTTVYYGRGTNSMQSHIQVRISSLRWESKGVSQLSVKYLLTLWNTC